MDKKKIRLALILLLLISGAFALAQDTGVTTSTPSLSICEDGDFTITVTNEGDTDIYDVEVIATVPDKFSYRGATGSYSTSGSPVTTVTWASFNLDPNDGSPGGGDEWTEDITISPDCDAEMGSRLQVEVYVDDVLVETAYSQPIERKVPFLALDVNPLVQTLSVGEEATWYVTITNTGPGDLYNVVLDALPEAGLTNLSPSSWPISLGDILSGDSSATIEVTADVDSCEDISITFTATSNRCGEGDDETCTPVIVEGSIELDYNTPNLNYTFDTDPIDIPYCGTDTVTVDVTNSGADAGNIRNFEIGVNLQPDITPSRQLDIALVSSTGDVVGVWYDDTNHRFVFPDLAPDASGTFTFSAAWDMAIPGHLCEPVDCESLIFEPYFTDDCGDEFYPPVKELPVASTPDEPSFSVVKTGPGVILNQGDVGTFTIEVTFNAPNTITTTADIIDNYPATFTFDSASGGGSDNGTRVLWNNEPFTGGQTRTFTVDLEAAYGGTDCGVGIDNNVVINDIGPVCSGCYLDDVSLDYTIMDSALLDIEKDGPDHLDINGASGTYDITVTYDGPLCNFVSGNRIPPFTVEDTYPESGIITANPDGGTIDTGARTITWTFPAQVAPPGGPPYEFDLSYDVQISSSAPDYDACLCGTTGSNNVTVTLSSSACIVCSDSIYVPFGYECDDELTAPIDIGKTANVDEQELCECITYTNTIDFGVDGIDWSDIDFTENGNNSQLFFGGSSTGDAQFTFYDDSENTTTGPINRSNAIDLGPPPVATNLGFLSGGLFNFEPPGVGDRLTVTYTICLTSASADGEFVSWTDVEISGYDNPCLTDDEFHEGAWVDAYTLAPDISIGYFCHYFNDVCSFVVNRCEEAIFRIYIEQSVPSYEVSPVVDLLGNYTYIDDPTDPNYVAPIYTGILSHHTGLGTVPTYDEGAGTLTWDLGDLDQPSMMGDGYIEFVLHKACDDESEAIATISFSDNCYIAQTPVTRTYEAYRTWGGELLLKKTPEVIYNSERDLPDPEWIIYVTNRGSGYAYNVKVIDTLGAGINYISHTVTGLSLGDNTVNPPIPPAGYVFDLTGAPEYYWLISYIPPGETVEIHLVGDVIACAARTNEVKAFWGCGTDIDICFENCSACEYCCEDIAPVTSRVEDLSTQVVITEHSNTPIDICGDDSTITIEYQNIGKSNAYDIILTEVLPDSLDWVTIPAPGFNMVFTPGTAPGVDCFTGFGYDSGTRTMTWNFACPEGIAPDDSYEITFDVDPGDFTPPRPWGGVPEICDFTFGDLLNLNLQYSPPCGFKGDVATNALTAEEEDPQLYITKDPVSVIGDPGDTLQWNIDIVNGGDSPATFIELWDNYPANVGPIPPATELTLTPLGSTPGPISGSGIESDPWVFDYSEVIDIGAGNAWSFTIDALVNDCEDSGTNEAFVEWGCCNGETSSDTSIVITTPVITLDQSIGGSGIVDNCGGTLVITIQNDGASGQFYELRNTLPPGFVYEANSTTITSTDPTHTFVDEPVSTGPPLTWDTTNIDEIRLGETITITFNILHQAWSTADCSLDPGGDNYIELDWDRSALCGTPDPTTETSTALIDPVVPVFTVTKIPTLQTVPPTGDPPYGDDVTWTIRLTETAGGTAEGTITIVDTLGDDYDMSTVVAPDITDYTGYTATPSILGHTITWSGLSIDPNGYIEFDLTCDTVTNPKAEDLSNIVDVSGMCGVACVYAEAQAVSHVGLDAITKSIVEDEATIGEVVEVNITVNFYGSDTAYEDITITDLLPTGLAYFGNESSSASCGAGISFDDTTMTWSVNDFTGPCVVNISFDAHVENISDNQDGDNLVNTATADYWIEGHHYLDTSLPDDLDIIEADLVITKDEDDGDDIVAYGDTVTYTIDVAHIAGDNADAFDVVVTDIIPDGYTYVSSTGGGVPTAGPGAGETTITWPAIDVPLGSSLTYSYIVTVDSDVEPAQELENESRVEWTSVNGTPTSPAEERTGTETPDYNDYHNETTDVVTVDTTSSITKTLDGTYTEVTIPHVMLYTITVGLPEATIPTLTVTDTMDAGIYYVTGTANVQFPNGSSSAIAPSRIIGLNDGTAATTLEWNGLVPIASFNNIDATSGNPLIITFNAVVANEDNVEDGLDIGNEADYDYTDYYGNHHTGSDTSRDVEVIEADLVITKDENDVDDIVSAGDTITYTIDVDHTAASHTDAFDVVVTDIIPDGYTYVSSTGGGVPSAGPGPGETTITWPATDISLVSSVTYSYVVTVDDDVEPAQELENESRVEWTSWNDTPTVGEERTGTETPDYNDYFNETTDLVTVDNTSSIHKMPDDDRDVTVSGANLFEVNYTIEVTLPRATIPDLVVTDIIGYLGEGLYYIPGAGNTTITYPGGATSNADPSRSSPNNGTVPVTLTWDFTGDPNLVPTTGGSWDPLTIEFTAVVADITENNDLDQIRNIASYSYEDYNNVTQGGSDESGLLVVHVPAFTIDKSVADIVDGFGTPRGTITEVQPGDVIHYSLVINNVGTGEASNVVVTDSLPQYFEYDVGNVLNVPYADVISPNLRDLTWNLGTIAGGGSVTIDVYAVVTSGLTLLISSYDNVADVVGEDIIGNQIPTDNNDHVTDTDLDDRDNIAVTPQIPALEVDKAVLEINGAPYGGGNVTIQPNDYVTYELTIRNVGNGTAYNVGAYDDLPIGMLYDTLLVPPSYTDAEWDSGAQTHTTDPSITGTSATGERLTWESPAVDVDLEGGDSYTIEYLVHVDSNIIEGLPAENYVRGYAIDGSSTPIPTDRNIDTLGADNDSTDDATTSIATREPFFVTDKVVSQIDGDPTNIEVAVIDSIVEFTITVENVGLGDAYDIDILDTLPVGFEYVPGSTVVDTFPGADPVIIPPVTGTDLSWLDFYPSGGGVPFVPGQIMTLFFEARVTPNSSGGRHYNEMLVDAIDANGNAVVRNGAAIGITADTDEDDADNAEIYVDVPTVPFVLTKEPKPRSLGPQGIVHYTVTFTNTRKIRYYDVTITDTMPKRGFKYYAGSTLIDGVPSADPTGDNPYTWTIGTVNPETTVILEYDVVVSHAAKSGANRNTIVLRGRDSAGNILELTTHAVVSVKRDKFKDYDKFPFTILPEEWTPEETPEKPAEEEIIPECCLHVWKIALKSQDFGKTLPGMPEIYYQTDIAMYGATEFFMIHDYLSPRLKIEGIDPEDKHLMTGLYNRIIEKLGEYAQYNLGNVVMKSELGIPYMYSPDILSTAKKQNKSPERVLDNRLKDIAKEAGLSEVPDIEPIFLEYFGSYPYLEGRISDGDLAWGERFMDKNIMPAALGFTLLRSAFQIDEFLKSDIPEERFFGLLILSQSLEKLEAMSEDLAVTASFSNPVKYLPHFSRIEIDENRPSLKYTMTDDTSTLYDQASVLWGLSKLRSVILHSQDLKVRENLDYVTEKMNEAYDSLEKIHFNKEDNTFISIRKPGDSGDYEITAKDLSFTILAMRSVLRDNRDTTLITEDPKRKIAAAADFMMEKMISAKDGGVYTSYSYATSSPDTGTRRTLVDNALAIRALLTAYVVTEDRKYREAALDIYDFMVENLWVEEYLIFVDEERWDYEVVLTPQSIGALIASLRELVLYGDEDMINDYLDKISYTTERILDQSQLQLYENRFYPWHAPLTLIPEDPNGRSYVKPIITPIRDKDVMRDLAPILVRKMVLNLTPAGAIASGDEDSIYDWNKWKANLRYEVPDLIASTLVDDTFVTDMGMYFSSLIYDYRHNVARELPSYDPYVADPDIQTYAAYLSDEVSGFNVKNLTLNSNMGIRLDESVLIAEMAKKKGVSPEKFVKDFVGARVPEPKRSDGIFRGVLGDITDFVSGFSGKRFDNIIYLEYAKGKPYYEKGISEGWDEDTFDTKLNPSSIAQTMLRQIMFLMDYEDRDDLSPADVFEKDVMKLVVVAKHRFLVDLAKDIEKEGLDYIPHGFELKWDKDEHRYVAHVTDKSSKLFDQVSLIWAMALWTKARDMGLFDEYEGYLGDRKQDDELTAKFFDALVKYHYDGARGTLITGSVNAVEIGKALDILTRAVEILPEGEGKDKMLDLISAQADFIIKEMLTDKGVLPLVDFEKKYTTDDLCEFENLGTHTFPILALFRTYEVTGNEKYLNAALRAFKIFDEGKWIQELGLYMSSGTIWEGKDLTKLELTYNNVELISTILLISELQPYMEGERKILSAYHMTTFMNRLLEIASLERYPENEESGKSIFSPQIVFSVKIVLSETKGNGSAGGVFTYLILADNDCIEEWEVDHTLHRIRIEDTLPKGFHFVPGSTRINGAFAPDPIGKETLNWYYPMLRDSGKIVLRYQVVADEDIDNGIIVNNLDVKSFWVYNGVLYPCDGFVEEGVLILDELEIPDMLGDGECVPCDPDELKRIQYR